MTKINFGKALGALIYRKRKILGLTQMQLAEDALGTSSKTRRISEIENGTVSNPHPKTIDPIISMLGITESELDSCFDEACAAPDPNLQMAYDEAEILINELAKQFELENENASMKEIDSFLRSKAIQFVELKNAIDAINATDKEIADLRLDAISALKNGDFDQVDTLLNQAEEKQQSEKTIKQIKDQADIRILRGDSRFLEGALEESYEHYSRAALFFEHFDSKIMIQIFNELAGRIYEHQRRSFKPKFWIASNLLTLALSKLNPDTDAIAIGTINFRLSLIYRNEASSSDLSTEVELLEKAVDNAREALRIFSAIDDKYKVHSAQGSLGNCLSQLTYVTEDPSYAEAAIGVLESARSTIPFDQDSQELMGHVCNSLGAAILRFHGTGEKEMTEDVLDSAMSAYEDAVTAGEKAADLEIFGTANINLARLLTDKSESDELEDYVAIFLRVRAISCFQAAIETYPENMFPDAFAEAQMGLAETLFLHARRNELSSMEMYFMRAINAYWQASTIFSEEHNPSKWAYIQCRLGSIFGNHAKIFSGDSTRYDVEKAISYFKDGLRVYTEIGSQIHIKSCSDNLSRLEEELSKIDAES